MLGFDEQHGYDAADRFMMYFLLAGGIVAAATSAIALAYALGWF